MERRPRRQLGWPDVARDTARGEFMAAVAPITPGPGVELDDQVERPLLTAARSVGQTPGGRSRASVDR